MILEPSQQLPFLWAGFFTGIVAFLSGVVGGLRLWRRKQLNKLTPEQREIRRLRIEHERAELARIRQIKRIAVDLRGRIIKELAQNGFTYIYERKGIHVKASKPEIGHVLYGSDAIWFRITKLPFRIHFTDLLESDAAQNLSLAIGRKCTFISDTYLGVWVQVDLKSGVNAIPNFYPWFDEVDQQNALTMLPRNRHTIMMGLAENRQPVYEDFRNLPHLLIAGATDGGKSVFLNQALCTLIKRNEPQQVKFVLMDLKAGLEFYPYRNLPHLWRPVVTEPQEVLDALRAIEQEKDRRAAMLRDAGKRKIQSWNKTQPDKLPYIVVVFDEIAQLMTEPKVKRRVEAVLRGMTETGRALGIHFWLCTQHPSRETITTAIKINAPRRVVFATDPDGSMSVIRNHMAARLTPKTGRGLYRDGVNITEIQAPFIGEEQIDKVIQGVTGSLVAAQKEAEAVVLSMFRAALELNGRFSVRDIYDYGAGEWSQRDVNEAGQVWEYDIESQEPVIELDGERYILAPPMNRRSPRMMIGVNGHLPTSLGEIYSG